MDVYFKVHSFSFDPSAQYKAIPISHSSRSERRPISLSAFSIISLLLLIRQFFRDKAPLKADCRFFSVNICFCFLLKPTSCNHNDSVDFATGTCFKTSEYERPCLLNSIALSLNPACMLLYMLALFAKRVYSGLFFLSKRSFDKCGEKWCGFTRANFFKDMGKSPYIIFKFFVLVQP